MKRPKTRSVAELLKAKAAREAVPKSPPKARPSGAGNENIGGSRPAASRAERVEGTRRGRDAGEPLSREGARSNVRSGAAADQSSADQGAVPRDHDGVHHDVKQLVVPEDREGQRLDNFLFNHLKGVPKTHVYRLLRTGQVRVNGKRVKADARVAGGDTVRVPPVRIAPASEAPRASDRSLETLAASIVFEDRLFLAIDKPSGLASHGGSGIKLGAIEQLRQLRPDETLELVHRLDRDTSGVLLFARRRSGLSAVQAEIRAGRVKKRYLALLAGTLPKTKVRVNAALQKSVLQGGERMVRVDEAGKPSSSEFRVITAFRDFTYVEVIIDTGRTHQIRVHAQHLGAPVAGDEKYGDAEANRALREVGLKRLFLHAAEFAFELPDGESYHLTAPLPRELASVLENLAKPL